MNGLKQLVATVMQVLDLLKDLVKNHEEQISEFVVVLPL